MRHGWLFVAVAACSAAPTPPPADPLATQLVAWHGVAQRAERGLLVVAPPHFTVRDVIGIERMPKRSPHLDQVATAWPTICEARGELADDTLEYTLAWCEYARDERFDLGAALRRLGTTPSLRIAVQADLESLDAEARGDVEATTGCPELEAVLEDYRPTSYGRVRALAAGADRCAHAARALVEDITSPRDAAGHLLFAYAMWGLDWDLAFDHAVLAMPAPYAEQVAAAVLTETLRTSCTRVDEVRERAARLLSMPGHDATWTPALDALARVTPDRCAQL